MKTKKPNSSNKINPNGKPRISMCICGHTGDYTFSSHADTKLEKGHGKCLIDGCKCKRFTWKGYL